MLAACAGPPPPPVRQSAPLSKLAPMPPVQAIRPAGEWADWPLTSGDWVYRRDQRGSIALFGIAGQDATVTFRCDIQRRRIYLARAGTGPAGRLVVRSSSLMKEFAASPTGASSAYFASEILPNDPILDAMAFSRGRIAIEVSGQSPIAIPSWPEITRIVEDCRS
jgi:hypothetical protein